MRTADLWLARYSQHHHHPLNRVMHAVSIPLAVIGVTGLLWSLPAPDAFGDISPALNWGTAFLLAAVVYYFILSIPLALGLLPFVLAVTGVLGRLDGLTRPLWQVSLAVLLAALVLQALGHLVESRRPRLLEDLQYLMIGPAWLMAGVFRRLGIPY
ncbi:MAG: DUF962 domain-containing protein [Gammaproteobacteria bacterium]|jgi:uncharacterized membrane protein YGL010W